MKKSHIALTLIILVIGAVGLIVLKGKAPDSPQHASKGVSLYNNQAKKICSMLDKSVALYQSNKPKQAHTLAENAYWNVYDNILEIKYRPYATPGYIFNVEDQFHQFSKSLLLTKENVNKQVEKQAKTLCTEVTKQAKFLTKKS